MKNRILILVKDFPVLPENCIVKGTQLLLTCSVNFRSGLFHIILFSGCIFSRFLSMLK